jgi:hypothetical protein
MRFNVAVLFFLAVPCLSAQTAGKSAGVVPAGLPASSTLKDLPVRQVILYKNGVGYFEHSGTVTGNQHVAIDFTSSQLNDVLQSLTILDENGGRIGGVNYNSTTPLAEQLKSLSLAMSDDPSSTELFQALRGQRVEVTGAPGGSLTGRLMSIESRSEKAGDANSTTLVDRYYLTLVTTAGAVRVVELTPGLSVRPLDAGLQGQLDRYLELLSSTRSTGLRHLTLDALGTGQRQLRVSYISEVPVWKSTYRIVFPKDVADKAIMQGWAVVDNTIGSDWDNVQLSLVAGAPQSFIQPLSQPLYIRRPEVAISTSEMTTPQPHEAAEGRQQLQAEVTSQAPVRISAGVISGSAGGIGSGSGAGYGPSSGGNFAGGLRKVGGGVYAATNALQAGDVNSNTFDDYFEYSLAQPVTIHKNESAMVPILQENLPAERVTLWSASDATPFRAVWLENTSKLTFDRGSFSIFESGVFAGQGLLDPIHPGEKRLLSYAADEAVHVRRHPEEGKYELRGVQVKPLGYIHLTYGAASKTNYIVANSANDARVVVLEVPRQAGRDLSPETKPAEIAPTLYRFRLPVGAHESASVLVSDEGPEYNDWMIKSNEDQAPQLRKLAEDAPAIAERLKPVIAAQEAIRDMKAQLHDLDQKSAVLTNDEGRARENLTALKGNDAAKRFVDELNRAEDELEATRKQTAELKEKEKAAVDALNQMLATLTIEWSVTAK